VCPADRSYSRVVSGTTSRPAIEKLWHNLADNEPKKRSERWYGKEEPDGGFSSGGENHNTINLHCANEGLAPFA
jgi:hypothetical protein